MYGIGQLCGTEIAVSDSHHLSSSSRELPFESGTQVAHTIEYSLKGKLETSGDLGDT